MKEWTLLQTLEAISADKGYAKEVFYGHAGFVVLWFDHKGYSITTHTRTSHGTSGLLSWEEAKELFLRDVTRIASME